MFSILHKYSLPADPLSGMFRQSVPDYSLPGTAFIFIYFQAAERFTSITHDASDALSLATGQETVLVSAWSSRRNVYRAWNRLYPWIPLQLQQAQSGNATPSQS